MPVFNDDQLLEMEMQARQGQGGTAPRVLNDGQLMNLENEARREPGQVYQRPVGPPQKYVSANPVVRALNMFNPVDTYIDAEGNPFYAPMGVGTSLRENRYLPDPGYAITKAARDTYTGLSELPSDVAEAAGADELAEAIDPPNMPPVQGGTLGEDIAAGVLQFGTTGAAAARGGYQAVDKLLPFLAQTGRLGSAARATGAIGGAALSDMAVVDPETQAGTLGDILGAGPTQSSPDDTGMDTRLKIGAESAAIPAVAPFVVKPVGWTAKGLGRFGQWVGDTAGVILNKDENVKKWAGRLLLDNATDPRAAMEAIEQGGPRLRDGSIQQLDEFAVPPGTGEARVPIRPLTSQVTQDPGLKALEEGLMSASQQPPQAAISGARSAQGPLADEAADLMFPPTQQTGAFGQGVASQNADELAGLSRNIDDLSRQAQDTATSRQALEAPIAPYAGTRPTASEGIDAAVQGAERTVAQQSQGLYDAIDAGARSVEVNPLRSQGGKKSLVSGVRNLLNVTPQNAPRLKPILAFSVDGVSVGDFLKDVRTSLAAARNNPAARNRVYFDDLQAWRKTMNGFIREANKTGRRGDVQEALLPLKEWLDGVPKQLAGGRGGPTAARAKAAEDFYNDMVRPLFREGEGGKYRDALRRGMVEPQDTGRRFLKTGTNAQQLDAILRQSPNQAQGRTAVRDWFVAEVADKAMDTSGTVNPGKITQILNKYRTQLDQFPDIRDELTQLRNQLQNNVETSGRLAQDLQTAQQQLAQATKAQQSGPAAAFVNQSDQTAAAGRVTGSKMGSREMDDLLRRAGVDVDNLGSPNASANANMDMLDDLVANFQEDIRRRIGLASDTGGRGVLTTQHLDQLNKITAPGTESYAALEKLMIAKHGPQQGRQVMQAWTELRRQLQMLRGPAASGSIRPGTPESLMAIMNKLRPFMAAYFGIIKGHAISNISKMGLNLVGLNPEEAFQIAMARAATDPEFALQAMRAADQPSVAKLVQYAIDTQKDMPTGAALRSNPLVPDYENAPFRDMGRVKPYVGEDILNQYYTDLRGEEN